MVSNFYCSTVHDEIGRGNFLSIYFASGVMGSVFSLTRSVILGRLGMTSLGASAATSGIVAAWCMSHFKFVSQSAISRDTYTNPP
jgi:rhomboid-like protein